MPLDVTATMDTVVASPEGLDPINMYAVNASLSGWSPLYFCDNTQDVTGYVLDSSGDITSATTTYTGYPIQGDTLNSNIEGEISGVTIAIPNVDQVLENLLQSQQYLRGCEVYIMTAFTRHLPSGSTYKFLGSVPDKRSILKEKFFIDTATSSEQVVSFTLKSKFDVRRSIVPARNYGHDCSWTYNSTTCGVTATNFVANPTCNLTLSDCRNRVNASRFGGFPSIPRKGFFVVG